MTSPIPRRHSIGLWLTAGSLAFLLCAYHLSATLVDGVFMPADHDSLYHARRILDSLQDPLGMYQFDARVHAPEGAWITWPWAYDTLMALAARGLVALTGAADPMTVLAFIAPAWVFVNAALMLGIAARLRLSLPMRIAALLFFAVSPLTQSLHRVGMLDHHYAEYSFVLAGVYLGLGWFGEPAGKRRAVALAALLGAAPAFHNGLFVLQLPVLVTVGWLWVLKRPLDRGATGAFAAALVVTTALFLLPSEPFRRGEFSFYLHSWFHLYIAACTASLCVLASWRRFSAAAAAAACALAAVMAAPILPQLLQGRDFIFGRHPYLQRIAEFGSIPRDIAEGNWWRLTLFYSPLLWLLPLGVAGLFWRLRRDASDASIHFLVQTLIGSFLLLQTFRLHYFGSFALILPLCRLIDDARELRPSLLASRARQTALGALGALCLAPGLLELQAAYGRPGHPLAAAMRGTYRVLGDACRSAPGVVLAEPNDGHFIRYYSECSSIADNFLTTPQDLEQMALSEAMMAAPAADVVRLAPYVRYMLVRRADDLRAEGCGLSCPENDGLRRELLRLEQPPPRLRLLWEVRVRRGDQVEPAIRLFEVVPVKLPP